MVLASGAVADVRVLRDWPLGLPQGATLWADLAYTDYAYEDLIREVGLTLIAKRKRNSQRPWPAWMTFLCEHLRRRIETRFSQITTHFARSIHAVTARGFELKVFLTVLAYSIIT